MLSSSGRRQTSNLIGANADGELLCSQSRGRRVQSDVFASSARELRDSPNYVRTVGDYR
jgi:hypothetical protein